MTDQSPVAAMLADAMDLSADDRALLARCLAVCVRGSVELEPESVRRSTDTQLRELFGE